MYLKKNCTFKNGAIFIAVKNLLSVLYIYIDNIIRIVK